MNVHMCSVKGSGWEGSHEVVGSAAPSACQSQDSGFRGAPGFVRIYGPICATYRNAIRRELNLTPTSNFDARLSGQHALGASQRHGSHLNQENVYVNMAASRYARRFRATSHGVFVRQPIHDQKSPRILHRYRYCFVVDSRGHHGLRRLPGCQPQIERSGHRRHESFWNRGLGGQ